MKEEENLPIIIRLIVFVFQVVFAVLFIVFTLLTFGIFLDTDAEKSKESRHSIPSKEEKLRIALERKKHRLQIVRVRIGELQLILQKIKRTERRMLFAVRLVIILLLLGTNWWYLSIHVNGTSIDKDNKTAYYIELITNFNALILLLYSVPAYLLYGTVSRFTAAMKSKTVSILRRKHFPSFSELQLLREEEQQILRDIGYLKTSLELFD